MVEIIGYLAAFLTTSSFLPQAMTSIKNRNTAGISLLMYSLFVVGIFCWLIYGIFLGNMIIIVSNLITLFSASAILFIKLQNIYRKVESIF